MYCPSRKSPCAELIRHYGMEIYGGVDAQFRVLLTTFD
jgi:hypothetical protein